MLALLVASGAVGGGVTLIEDRQSGFLRPLLLAPVSRTSLVLGKLAARTVASLLLVCLLVAILAAFTPLGLPHPGAVVLSVIGITSSFMALGIALASRLRSLESFRLLSALVTVPLYLLSGIFYPVRTLPAVTRWISQANPLTYGVDLLRYGVVGVHEIPLLRGVVVLALLSAGAVVLAVAAFGREGSDRP